MFLELFSSLSSHRHTNKATLLLASALGVLGLLLAEFWWTVPLSLGLFFFALSKTRTYKGAVWFGLGYGMAISCAGIWWFWYTLPLDFLPIPSGLANYAVFMAWLTVSFVLATPVAFGAVALRFVKTNTFHVLVFAILWTVIEEGRMWAFAILTLGAQSLFGPHFSISALGNGVAENSYLLQLASYGGLTSLNFFVALIGALLSDIPHLLSAKKIDKTFVVSVVLLIGILLLPLLFPYQEPVPARMFAVDLVSTNATLSNDQMLREADTEISKKLLIETSATSTHPNIVILPEGNGLRTLYPDDTVRTRELKKLFGTSETLVVSGDTVNHSDRPAEVKLFYDSSLKGEIGSYTKLFLMPLGEYTPYIALPAYATLHNKLVDTYLNSLASHVDRGDSLVTVPYDGAVLGGLLCSDILSPSLYHDLVVKNHATLLVNVANPGWFHSSRLLYARTIEMAKIQAVENRVYLLTSANNAPAFAIDAHGTIIAQSPWGEIGILPVTVPVFSVGH